MKIQLASIYVDDLDKALRFYTQVAGFVKKTDVSQGGYRWLTVASPEEPDGTELHLERNDNAAAKAYQQALFQQSQPAAMFYTDDVQGDYERLMEVLDPDVVLRVEGGAGAPKLGVVRGARRVANGAKAAARFGHQVRLALVNGAPGAILLEGGRPVTLASFTIIEGKIVEIDVLMDPERLAQL